MNMMATVSSRNQTLTQQTGHQSVLIKGRSPFKVIGPDLVIAPDNAETLRHLAIKATGLRILFESFSQREK
jgi:hypothetical protein